MWKNLIGQMERSGTRPEEFATKREIPVGTLRWWMRKLKREQEEAAILPVRVVASPS
jgi:predicted transcriptional regulator